MIVRQCEKWTMGIFFLKKDGMETKILNEKSLSPLINNSYNRSNQNLRGGLPMS